jgi:exonuclease III
MMVITWNYRGLGNGPAVCGLLNIQKEEDPDILFLSETKMDLNKIEGLRWWLGLTNLVVKDCRGKSGGLAVFWRKGVNFHLRAVSSTVTSTVMWWRIMVSFGGSQAFMESHALIRRSSHGKHCVR